MGGEDMGAAPVWIAIPLLIVLFFLRVRHASRDRRLRVEWLWVTPLLLLIVAGLVMQQSPLLGFEGLWLLPAFAIGAGIGYWRGRLTVVTIDPTTHVLTSRASPAALYLLVCVMILRMGLRVTFTADSGALHLNAALVTDGFLVFAVGLVAVQRIEIWIRARRLLAEARAAGGEGVRQTPSA